MDKNVFFERFLYFGLRFKVKTLINISLELIVTNAYREVIALNQWRRHGGEGQAGQLAPPPQPPIGHP